MTRRTKNPRIALERLVAHMGYSMSAANHRRGHYHVDRSSNGGGTLSGNPCSLLARLTVEATAKLEHHGRGMTYAEVRDVVRLTRMSERGCTGHDALTVRSIVMR